MKNDILLFAVMFALAWIGYTVAKDRLPPTPIISQATVADDEAAKATASAALTGNGDTEEVYSKETDQKKVAPEEESPAASKTKETATSDDAESAEPKTAEEQIEKILADQIVAWNKGDLDGFMDAYWNDEALTISGGGDTSLGWESAYANYRQRYPEGEMGTIAFKNLKTEMAGKEAAIVTGSFNHQLADEKVNGNFSLVVKMIDRKWKIINDHTSVDME